MRLIEQLNVLSASYSLYGPELKYYIKQILIYYYTMVRIQTPDLDALLSGLYNLLYRGFGEADLFSHLSDTDTLAP